MSRSARRQSGPDPEISQRERAVAAQGNIESIRAGSFTGWAVAMVEGKSVPLLEVRILHESGEVLGRGFATEFRRDVQDAGLPTGWCGFSLAHAALLPDEGTVTLQALVESTWILVAQLPIVDLPSDVFVSRDLEVGDYFADLLSVFAAARTTGGTVGKSTMRVGTDLWIQASSSDADSTLAALRLGSGDRAQPERPFLRVEAGDTLFSRVDVRFRLGKSLPQSPAHTVRIPVRTMPQGQGTVKVNVFADNARTALSTYQVTTSDWAVLEATLPALDVPTFEPNDARSAVWLEVVGSDLAVLDIGEMSIVAVTNSPFESAVVGAQSDILTAGTGVSGDTGGPVEDFTVVIPFYGNHAFTGHCLDAVMMNSVNRVHVILVDDGTPHHHGQQFLGGLRERVSIVRFASNRGYTAAVNAGVLAARTPKVIILNNDTRVLPGWDAPLLSALDDEKVFSAGPLSNAASYQSVPEQRSGSGWAVNEYPSTVRPRRLAGALVEEFSDRALDWPILNGFCYAVRAASFIDLGMLDQGAFPRGYGEEVDLMLRSADAGYRNVIVPASFVYHYKSKTFAGERAALSSASNLVLKDRWGERLPDTVAEMDDSEGMEALRSDVRDLLVRLTAGEPS